MQYVQTSLYKLLVLSFSLLLGDCIFTKNSANFKQLYDATLHIFHNVLRDQTIFLTYDLYSEELFNISELVNVSQKVFFIFSQDSSTTYDSNILLQGVNDYCHTAVFIVGQYPVWIDSYEDELWFDTIIIMNYNNSYNAKSLLKNKLIQKSKFLLLLELYTNNLKEQTVKFYSSQPFYKNDQELKVGLADLVDGCLVDSHYLLRDRFTNFQQEPVNIASDYDDYPLLIDNGNNTARGMNMEIVAALSKWLNFSYTSTYRASDNSWGELVVNRTYDGLLGDVQHGGKNMTINYFTLTTERVEHFDASIPYFWEGFGFALRTSEPFPHWHSLIYPFDWKVSFILVKVALMFTVETILQGDIT